MIQRDFCLLYLQVRENGNRSEKSQKFEKIQLTVDMMATFFWKISPNSTNFEVSSLGLEFQVSVLESLMRSRSWSFNQASASVSKVTVSTTSLAVSYPQAQK